MEEHDWDRLVEQLTRGECTPFVGAGACRTLPASDALSEKIAEHYRYPFPDTSELSRVAQYVAILHDPFTVKDYVCRVLRNCNSPDFTDESEPHTLLAGLPLPVYLTTNYDNFMFSALEQVDDKDPSLIICPWHTNVNLAASPPLAPCSKKPIVYHLHGSYTDPLSLVLTDEDYLDFLSRLAWDQGVDGKLIPPAILLHFAESPLLFIGYSLQDWTFQTIFHSLYRRSPEPARRRHVSVQLPPPRNKDDDTRGRIQDYLDRHFDRWKITVFWGKAEEFCATLRDKLR